LAIIQRWLARATARRELVHDEVPVRLQKLHKMAKLLPRLLVHRMMDVQEFSTACNREMLFLMP
jgi:hypothetical protein